MIFLLTMELLIFWISTLADSLWYRKESAFCRLATCVSNQCQADCFLCFSWSVLVNSFKDVFTQTIFLSMQFIFQRCGKMRQIPHILQLTTCHSATYINFYCFFIEIITFSLIYSRPDHSYIQEEFKTRNHIFLRNCFNYGFSVHVNTKMYSRFSLQAENVWLICLTNAAVVSETCPLFNSGLTQREK